MTEPNKRQELSRQRTTEFWEAVNDDVQKVVMQPDWPKSNKLRFLVLLTKVVFGRRQ